MQPDYSLDSTKPGDLAPRFLARLIDTLIITAVGFGLGALFGFGVGLLLAQVLLTFGYFVVLDVTYATTPGKRLLQLRVTGPTGASPTVGQAAVREAFTVIGAIPYLGPILAPMAWVLLLVTIHQSPTKQGTHDRLAGGTQVVATA